MSDERMARDVEVLQQVMEAHDLNVKRLANKSGIAQKTIYKYLSGVRTLPSDVLRAAYEITQDQRLLHLISGAAPVVVELIPLGLSACKGGGNGHTQQTPLSIPPVKQALPRTLSAIRKAAESGECLATILEDGSVDRKDIPAMDNFLGLCNEAKRELELCRASVQADREKVVSA